MEAELRSLMQDDSGFISHYNAFQSYLPFLSWDDKTCRLAL